MSGMTLLSVRITPNEKSSFLYPTLEHSSTLFYEKNDASSALRFTSTNHHESMMILEHNGVTTVVFTEPPCYKDITYFNSFSGDEDGDYCDYCAYENGDIEECELEECVCSGRRKRDPIHIRVPVPRMLYSFIVPRSQGQGASVRLNLDNVFFLKEEDSRLHLGTRLYQATLPNVYGDPAGRVCSGEDNLREPPHTFNSVGAIPKVASTLSNMFWSSPFNKDLTDLMHAPPFSLFAAENFDAAMERWGRTDLQDMLKLPMKSLGDLSEHFIKDGSTLTRDRARARAQYHLWQQEPFPQVDFFLQKEFGN